MSLWAITHEKTRGVRVNYTYCRADFQSLSRYIAKQFGQLGIGKLLTVEQQRIRQPGLEVRHKHEDVDILNFSLERST